MLSRTEMAARHRPLFKELCEQRDVIVVSGAREEQVRRQIPGDLPGSIYLGFYVLSQYGNHAYAKNAMILWKESFTSEQTAATLALIEIIKKELALTVSDASDLIEQRGSQISYSPIGHHEQLEKKYAFDPDGAMRRRVIGEHKVEVSKLNVLGVDVVPGGTTCFDFFLLGKNKGYNIARLIKHEKWDKVDCIYVGDALFPGGNDETVIGVIPTHPVKDPDETFAYVKTLL